MDRTARVVLVIAAVTLLVATGGVLRARGQGQLRACQECAPPEGGGGLPPIRGGGEAPSVGEALQVLSFDDGTCESGLGAGTTMAVTDYVEFDVPPQCFGLPILIVAVTTRLNTGMSIDEFAFGPSGTAAPPYLAGSFLPISGIPAIGPCPGTTLTQRPINPGSAVISSTSNFFAGVRAAGFVGRDTNGPPAGRIWLNCGFCGMTQYSPTTLSSIGLGGNWMIRVTIEDCIIPVELIGFDVG